MCRTIIFSVLGAMMVLLCPKAALSDAYVYEYPCHEDYTDTDIQPADLSCGTCWDGSTPSGWWSCETGYQWGCEDGGTGSTTLSTKNVLPWHDSYSHTKTCSPGAGDSCCCWVCTAWGAPCLEETGDPPVCTKWTCIERTKREGITSYTRTTRYDEHELPLSSTCGGEHILPVTPSCSYTKAGWTNYGCKKYSTGGATGWKWNCNDCPPEPPPPPPAP